MRTIITGLINIEMRPCKLTMVERFNGPDCETCFHCDRGHEFTTTLLQISDGWQCGGCVGKWMPPVEEPQRPSIPSLESLVHSKRKLLRAKTKVVGLPLTVVEQRAEEKGVALISEYLNYHSPTRWRCHAASHVFETRPANIFNGPGCPQCRKARNPKKPQKKY